MPGIGGRQLANDVIALHPEIKVVYISGYPNDLTNRHGIWHPETVLLEKPFTLSRNREPQPARSRQVNLLCDRTGEGAFISKESVSSGSLGIAAQLNFTYRLLTPAMFTDCARNQLHHCERLSNFTPECNRPRK